MGELLIRRREMILSGESPSPTPTPIYELASPLSAVSSNNNYDTGVKLFDTPKSFTILCESNTNWYPWASTQSIFGIGTGYEFRLGRTNSANHYQSGSKTASSSSYYNALAFNNTTPGDADPDVKKVTSLGARGSSGKVVRRHAVRYDHTTYKAEGFSTVGPTFYAPTERYFYLHDNYISNATLKLEIGTSAYCGINIFKVYDSKLTDEQINAFLNGGS